MHNIATPNWLAIAGFIYLTFAFGLALSGMMRAAPTGSLLQRTRAEAGRRIDAMMAMPFLVVGMVGLVLAQLTTAALSPAIVVLILSAPMALLLYAGFEGLWVEAQVEEVEVDEPVQHKPLLRLPSPVPASAPASHTHEIAPVVAAPISGAAG